MKKSQVRSTSKSQLPKSARPMTKRQLSRHQKDLKLQRITKIGFAALFALVLLVVAFGYWRIEIAPAGEAIMRVRGVPISTETYAKVLGYRQFAIDMQIARWQAIASQQSSQGDASTIQGLVQQQVEQLSQQRGSLEGQVLEDIADDELIRQEATRRGIKVTATDVDAEIYKQYLPPTPVATAVPGPDSTATPTPSVTPTPLAPTPTPLTQEDAMADVRKQLNTAGLLSEAEYRRLIMEPSILRDRLQEQLAAATPAATEQVWSRHILVDDEVLASDIITKLQGGADFADLAKQHSKDTSNSDKGGDLGWFTRGAMVPEFEEVAFKLQVGQVSQTPVKTSFGYHVIQTLGYEENRPLSDDQLARAKESALGKWLQNQRSGDPNLIKYDYNSERLTWARNWIDRNAKYLRQEAPQPAKKR